MLLFWILVGLLGAVVAFVLYLLGWSWAVSHKPDGQKSLSDHWRDESQFPCPKEIVSEVKNSLLLFVPGNNQFPELDYDAEGAPALALVDENYGYILIRTPQMCGEDETPLFMINGCSCFSSEDSPFESVDAEIVHYLDGAQRIRSKVLEAGIQAPNSVVLNNREYVLEATDETY